MMMMTNWSLMIAAVLTNDYLIRKTIEPFDICLAWSEIDFKLL